MTLLRDFIGEHHGEILARARVHVSKGEVPFATEPELATGLPLFIEQLRDALLRATTLQVADHGAINDSAAVHGEVLFEQGLTMEQVVHDYGRVCEAITGLAVDLKALISADDYRTLNLCLDDAIAGAVGAYGRQRGRAITDESTERLGVLAHELRDLLNTALMSFVSIKEGVVASAGSTSAMHERSLMGMLTLIDRSLADVRLDSGLQNLERVAVWEILTEVEVGAAMIARKRGLRLALDPVDRDVIVEADRQILSAAVANLVHNALKFTRRGTMVTLRASTTATRVLIDVEDECGGLPPGQAEDLLQPFHQQGRDRTGLGLGLSICVKAVKAIAGELHILDLPGKGCIFTIDLPKQPPPPTSIHAHNRSANNDESDPRPSNGGRAVWHGRRRRNTRRRCNGRPMSARTGVESTTYWDVYVEVRSSRHARTPSELAEVLATDDAATTKALAALDDARLVYSAVIGGIPVTYVVGAAAGTDAEAHALAAEAGLDTSTTVAVA